MAKGQGMKKTVGPRRYNALNRKTKHKKNRAAQFAANVQRLNYTNAQFAQKDETFRECCELAKIEPSKRQAADFRRGVGIAFAMLRQLQHSKVPDTAPQTPPQA